MARIGATISGLELTLLNRLSQANSAATLNQLRLATEKNINYPRDNPSIFSTLSMFQSRLSTVTTTMSNVTAASSRVTQTQSALSLIRTQLDSIRTTLLTDEAQALSSGDRAAAQTSIDAAVAAIGALALTDIDGRRTLDGSAAYNVSGRNTAEVADLVVHSTVYGSTPAISGTVDWAATQAQLVYTGSSTAVTAGDGGTLTIGGALGNASITIADAEALTDVATKINNQSHKTGITAYAAEGGNTLTFTSVAYGSKATLAVGSDAAFSTSGGNDDDTANGTDMIATIGGVTYSTAQDGSTPMANLDGRRLTVNKNGFHYEIEFAASFAGQFDTISVSGDALTFALSADLGVRSTLAIPSLQAENLGGVSGKLSDLLTGGAAAGLDTNTAQAIRIVDEALGDLDKIEGSVDGFYNAAITSSSNLLADLETDLQTAIDETDGYDENEQILLLAKNQQLMNNITAGLAILTQQRSNIIVLIQRAAGLI